MTPLNPGDRRAHRLHVIGRLKDHVTAEAAETELRVLNEQWGERVGVTDHMFVPMPADAAARASNPDAGHILQMRPLHKEIVTLCQPGDLDASDRRRLGAADRLRQSGQPPAVAAAVRRRELAVRTALGASRRRLLRQFMTEGALLSIAGSALALWLGRFGLHALTQAYPRALPRATEVSVDLPVLLFTCGMAMATSMFFGLAQLRHIGVKGLAVTLTEAGAKGAGGGTRRHVRRALVVGEVALAVILVIGAGLLIRTVYNLANVDVGFEKSRLVTFSISLPERTYPGPVIRMQAYQRVLDALRAVPGVEAATAMFGLPPDRPAVKNNTRVADATIPSVGQFHVVDYYQYVMPDYFETMGIPIVRGRSFQPADATSPGLVAVVNEKFADTFWKGRDPIGQRVKPSCPICRRGLPSWALRRMSSRGASIRKPVPSSTCQFSRSRGPLRAWGSRHSTTWCCAPPSHQRHCRRRSSAPSVKTRPAVPVVRLRDMETVLAESIQRPRFLAQLLGVFAGLALLLAAVGTYGVVSSIVAERRSEIGIRMALGADRSSVLAGVMREGLVLAGIGVVVGLSGAFALNRLIASLLFGVRPTDVSTVAGVAATMILVAAVACLLPAWRASRLDPSAVLRA